MIFFPDKNYFAIFAKAEKYIKDNAILADCWGQFRLLGRLLCVGRSMSLIVLYFIIFANPLYTLVCAYERRAVLAYIDLAEMCGPWIISASILSIDHAGTQLTGQP